MINNINTWYQSQQNKCNSITYDSNTGYITINTDGAHNLSVGDIVTVNGANPTSYSGNFTIIADSFANESFNVLPRDGETPTSTPATGTITLKLANGYFADTEQHHHQEHMLLITNTLVGGKQIVFDIPGNAITVKEEQFITPQAGVVTSPDASAGDVTGTVFQVQSTWAVVVQIVILMDKCRIC